MVKSPCINICTLNDKKICIGCYRSAEEISRWNFYNDEEKKKVIENIIKRKSESGIDYYGFG